MKAITENQPRASLVAAGVVYVLTRARSTSYRGRIAIHADLHPVGEPSQTVGHFLAWNDAAGFAYLADKTIADFGERVAAAIPLPLGAVVASAVLTDCVPIVADAGKLPKELACVEVDEGELSFWPAGSTDPDESVDPSDQLPYGDFSPGRWALLLDDIKPTTERCPWCWGADDGFDTPCLKPDHRYDPDCFSCQMSDCPACGGDRVCDPVPASGEQAVPWEWTA